MRNKPEEFKNREVFKNDGTVILNFLKKFLYQGSWMTILIIAGIYIILLYIVGNLQGLLSNNVELFYTLIQSSFTIAGFAMTIGILTLNPEKKKAYIGKKFFSHATIFVLAGFY